MKEKQLTQETAFKGHKEQDWKTAHRIWENVQAGAFPNLKIDTNTLYVDSVNHRVGMGNIAPGYTLDVTGNIRCSTGFACNGKNPQTAYETAAALAAYSAGANGLDTAGHMQDLVDKVKDLDAALIAMGICK